MTTPRILIVAGSDSGGGAGLQADIKTVTMFGGHAMTAVTAITAQNSLGVEAVLPVSTELVLRQIDMVVDDLGVDAVKIGMIGSAATAAALVERLAVLGVPIVFDPVMVSSSGAALADQATIAAFDRLARLATVTTPNLPELEVLTLRRVETLDALEDAACRLADATSQAVLAKGGHLPSDRLTDVLAEPGGAVTRWTSTRIDTPHTHGTGCTLASGIAVGLAADFDLKQAIGRARDYVRAAILAAPGIGAGHGPMGHALGVVPVEHIHRKE
ncbi:MAG: bifunctional hydroxymethylpyrimidine kinase/phosphomethylpyrimidine kinase [Allosphingosinicella sp.]